MLIPNGNGPNDATQSDAGKIRGWRIGEIRIDPARAEVTVGGVPVALDRSGYLILLCLVERAGSIVGKDDLLRAGWPGRMVSENSLAKAISKLRQAIGDDSAENVRVVHGYGYRLHAPVERIELAVPGPADAITAPPPPPARALARRWLTASGVILLVLATLVTALWLRLRTDIHPPAANRELQLPLRSLAVLPFEDLSADGSLRHFSDGLADQLLGHLAQLPRLRVALPAPSFAIRDQGLDAHEIGRQLGVQGLVRGSIRRAQQRLRITLQLVDTRDGSHRWSQTFERPETELFALQDELTFAITRELGVGGIDASITTRTTTSTAAYIEWLRARSLYRNDESGERRFVGSLERALAIDPTFADAWIELGSILGQAGLYADNPDELRAGRVRAFEAVERGIALAPDRPDGYLTRAVLRHAFRNDFAGALADLDHADALSTQPIAESLVRRARLLASLGRLEEAVILDRQAMAADPRSVAWTVLGWHYLALGDLGNARRVLEHDATLRPDSEHTQFYLGMIDIFEGHAEAALSRFEQSSGPLRLTGTVIARHELGDGEAMRSALATLQQRYPDAGAYQIAEARAWIGDIHGAFAALDHAEQVEDAGLTYLKFDPLLQNLRSDPRYRERLRRLGLPEA